MSKKKILIISDHALSPSGVGVQTKYLVEGLLKTNDYEFIQLGAAVKHQNYSTVKVNDNFYIKPIDGFGNPVLLRSVILNEQPDALLIFTDPRFFTWLFQIEDEIRQVCPILWWHVWDNKPTPKFNYWMYDSTDAINCHSYLTYLMCKENYDKKTTFIPHAFPKSVFYKIDDNLRKSEKKRILGEKRKDNFVCLWMNRNCKRKRPGDVLYSWKLFLESLNKEDRKNVTLLLHTNPKDNAGCNLFEIGYNLDILDTVAFSTEKVETEHINVLHNISDVCLNMSFNEGFGLTTLESMMTGTPIIAAKTGGLYRQVIDFRDNTENGIAIDIKNKSLVGSQNVPYIFEDYVDNQDVANAIMKIYKMNFEEKLKLSEKVINYANFAFNYENTINLWDKSIRKTIEEFKCQKQKTNVTAITLK